MNTRRALIALGLSAVLTATAYSVVDHNVTTPVTVAASDPATIYANDLNADHLGGNGITPAEVRGSTVAICSTYLHEVHTNIPAYLYNDVVHALRHSHLCGLYPITVHA